MDLLVFGSIAMGRAVLSVRFTDSKIPIGILNALNKPTCPISSTPASCEHPRRRYVWTCSSQIRRNTELSEVSSAQFR
jgi:hypothetical protein